jgi:hypothetical protein
MRLSYSFFVGFVLLTSSGCTTVPTVMGISGSDALPLSTREQVHNALGLPVVSGTVDGTRFEEFRVPDRNDQVFLPLDQFNIHEGELRLIAVSDISDIPDKGNNLIILANIENVIYFRLFDEDGAIVVDTDETKLPTRTGPIADLRKLWGNLWVDHTITDEEHSHIITTVAAIVADNPPGSFELGVGTVKHIGPLLHVIMYPVEDDLSRRRVLGGQTLRFEFDDSGNTTKVYLDGVFLLSPTKKSRISSMTAANTHGCVLIGLLSGTSAP